VWDGCIDPWKLILVSKPAYSSPKKSAPPLTASVAVYSSFNYIWLYLCIFSIFMIVPVPRSLTLFRTYLRLFPRLYLQLFSRLCLYYIFLFFCICLCLYPDSVSLSHVWLYFSMCLCLCCLDVPLLKLRVCLLCAFCHLSRLYKCHCFVPVWFFCHSVRCLYLCSWLPQFICSFCLYSLFFIL
jgi:hypothetical protein